MEQIRDIMLTMEYGSAPEDASDVMAWLAARSDGIGHFIDGSFTAPAADARFQTLNPATEDTLASVAEAQADDVDRAVHAARAALPQWAALSGHQRARHLYAIARHIQKRARFFAVLESLDNGKPIRETRDIDIPLVARHFYHHAGWAELIESEFADYAPVGVCGQIIPWNFPLLMLAWKVAPALAAGNTVVLKPAEQTPLTAAAFAEVCDEVGLPAGVVNIIHGDGRVGAALTAHDGIDKIAFTGSTEVGRSIRETLAGSGKKLSLELGGKSPFIVFEDADLDAAVEGVVDAIWFNQGEVCCAGSRLLVQEGVAPLFFDKLRGRMEALRIGSPLDKSIDIGAVVSAEQLGRIRALIVEGEAEGGTLWRAPVTVPDAGYFQVPGFFTNVDPAQKIAQVEIFGPIAVSTTFRTPAEAVALANNTRYGLAASIWTENINLGLDVAAKVKAGVVWINATNLFDAGAGFGGYRESGFGREGGREGLYEYLVPACDTSPTAAAHEEFVPRGAPVTSRRFAPLRGIDRTAKNYIGGKQARPDSGYCYDVLGAGGSVIGEAPLGNRKDIRNAVEAAAAAGRWGAATAHNRAQVLYFLGENLDQRRAEFVELLIESTGQDKASAETEFDIALQRIFYYAAQADKFDGAVHATQSRHVTLAMNEPWGIMGLVTPESAPLLGFVSLLLPMIAMGNRVVAVPSARHPLLATNLYQVLETSDVPGGVVNIVTGARDTLAKTLAEHDEVAAIWYFGTSGGGAMVERASCGNLKATWVNDERAYNVFDEQQAAGREFLRRAVQVKNIWVPYGE